MSRTRLAFVFQDSLGWKTYRAQFEAVLATRKDIDPLIVPVSLSRRQTLFQKHNYMSPAHRLVRRRDPITAYQGRAGASIRSELAAFKPAAVHFAGHLPAGAIAGLPGAPPFTVALDSVRTAFERDLSRFAWTQADKDMEAGLLREAAHVFPMSTWAANSVIEDCGVMAARVTVMPPSVDLSRYRPARDCRTGPLRVVFVGNDFRRKGGDRIVKWITGPLAGLAEVHIVSASADACRHRDVGGVVCHGYVPNDRLIDEILPEMDLLCLPTCLDLSPYVLAEAAAAGLPVVASSVGGISNLVIHGTTGLLLPSTEDAAFETALTQLARDRSLVGTMGAAARAIALDRLSAERNFNLAIDRLKNL